MTDPPPVRQQPSWFEAADEIILDYVAVREPTTPAPIGEYTDLEFETVFERAAVLEAAGLLTEEEENIYSITDRGRGYLEGEVDLRDEPEPE